MNYYPHHLGDYAKDTGHLSLLEHGAYRLMLDHYYSTEKPLPAALAALCRICRAVTKLEREAVASVAAQFFTEEGGLLHHARVAREIANYNDRADAAAQAGKASGEARRAKAEAKRKTNDRSTEPRTEDERPFNDRSNSVAVSLPIPLNNPNSQEPIAKVLLEKEPKGADAPDPVRKSALKPAFPLPPAVEAKLRSLYRRKDSTPWSAKELAAARPLRGIPEEQLLTDLELFDKTRAAGWQFYRRDAFTLMNNWSAEVERCSDYLRTEANGNHHRPATRQAPIVTRNTAPLPADSPDLDALSWKPALLPDDA